VSNSITSSEELETELERWSRRRGTPADFELAVKGLAPRLDLPLTHRTALRIARVGWTSCTGHEEVPATELPEFQGRPWNLLPDVARRDDAAALREQLPDETLPGYVGRLGESALAALGVADEAPSALTRAVAGYVSVLAIPGLRSLVGWDRSVDAHALGMLMAERGLSHLGEVGMTDAEEEACFRWLHLATYVEVTPAHLEEMWFRRELRLAHGREPAGAVAVMTCEVPVVGALWFQEKVKAMPTAMLGREQLRHLIDHLAKNGKDAGGWRARKEAFAEVGHLDLTAAAAGQHPDHDAFIHGHLMRWMVEEDVPVRPHLLGWTSSYARAVHRYLIDLPATKGTSATPVSVHFHAIRRIEQQEGSVPLTDELVLLAWLMDQRRFGVRLASYLEARDRRRATSSRPAG